MYVYLYCHWCREKNGLIVLPKLMSELIDLHKTDNFMLLRTWSAASPHEYYIHFTFQKLLFPPIKIPTVTLQNKEENDGNVDVSIIFFGCGVNIEPCEAHGATKKKNVEASTWKKVV